MTISAEVPPSGITKIPDIFFGQMASNKIGEHLLKGWTLMGESCPLECNTPLMRSPDRKSLICFSCNTDFLTYANAPTHHSDPKLDGGEGQKKAVTSPVPHHDSGTDSSSQLRVKILNKLDWASDSLAVSTNVDELLKLGSLIETLVRIRNSI